jgi:phosphoribosylformylglycinamidine cyclo-ligase
VGVVDRPKILKPDNVQVGDRALGISSSGFHSNGFSLLRRLFASPEDLQKYGEALLTPTAIYVDVCMTLLQDVSVSAMAHITGGGIHNVSRVLPKGLGLQLQPWVFPDLVKEAQFRGGLSDQEMLKTFNCGVGMVVLLPEEQRSQAQSCIESAGFQVFDFGPIVPSDPPLIFPESWS